MATNPLSEFMSGVKKLWFVATGAAADNSAVSGNPLLIGGRYSTTPATRHDGDVATIETDSQGRVLTVVSGSNLLDTAPMAVKSVQKKIVTTVINAVSVAPGGNTGYISCGTDGTEDEVWIAVNIDKQPWSVYTRNWKNGGGTTNNYPEIKNKTTAYATVSLPCMSLLMGIDPTAQGLPSPTTLSMAKEMIIPHNVHEVYVKNEHATDNATITVQVIRIWR